MSASISAVGCALALLALGSCATSPGDGDLETLRHQVGSDPRDAQTHRRLGLALARRGFPGGARRHLEIAARNGALVDADRSLLGELYAESAAERAELGDAGGMADAERARQLGVAISDALEARLWRIAALAAARARDRLALLEALAALEEHAAADPLLSLLRPERAELGALAAAGLWLHRGGARALALSTLDTYLDRGGQDETALRAWVEEKRWWGARSIEAAHTAALLEAGLPADAVTEARPVEPPEVAAAGRVARLQWRRWGIAAGGALASPAQRHDAGPVDADELAVQIATAASDRRNLGLEPGLARVARAYRRDPALAHRRARELADRRAAVGVAAPALAELFHQLGDADEALEWMRAAAASSPHHPPYLLGLAAAAAHDDDPAEADVHIIFASERAGDTGWVNLEGGRALARAGHPVAALTALRRALQLTGPANQDPVLRWIAAAQRALGREPSAPAQVAIASGSPAESLLLALDRGLPAIAVLARAVGDERAAALATRYPHPLLDLPPPLRRRALSPPTARETRRR